MFLSGIVSGGPESAAATTNNFMDDNLIYIVFFSLLALTPLYLWRVSNVTNVPQIIVTTISYVVWVYTLGGPFSIWGALFPRGRLGLPGHLDTDDAAAGPLDIAAGSDDFPAPATS
jgi:hypothetical protein